MTIMELGALGEFVGAFAVVATLIYLAVQIRQNTQHVHMQLMSETMRLSHEQESALMGGDPGGWSSGCAATD